MTNAEAIIAATISGTSLVKPTAVMAIFQIKVKLVGIHN